MQTSPRRIGILAGGGSLPLEIAESASRRGLPVSIVAIEGEADQDWSGYRVTHANWGKVGRMIGALKRENVTDLVIAGRVRRPDLSRLRPDVGFFAAIAHVLGIYASGGDDSVLRAVVRFFERKGLRVIGVAEAAPELVITEGPLGPVPVPAQCLADVRLGFELIRALGAHDIGQAVVVREGRVEAIEAAEGTDGVLARVARMRRERGGVRGGVLVKRPKPAQELRVDMPAIGPETVNRAADAGLQGIAVLEGQVVAVEREALIAASEAHGVFIAGVTDPAGRHGASGGGRPASPVLRRMGEKPLSRRGIGDAMQGLDALETLGRFNCSSGAVVSGGYVIAVESGEGAAAMIARAGSLRQWGRGARRRRGMAALRHAGQLDADAVAAATAAGLEGIAVDGGEDEVAIGAALQGAAAAAGLALVRTEIGLTPVAGRPLKLFLVAGEPSGDALGERLMSALSARPAPAIRYEGVGGAGMESLGLRSIFPLSDVAVMGPLMILKRLPRLVRRVHQTVDACIASKPDAVVIIDSPEFTHPIARRIRKAMPHVPIVDYVSPSVWAWRSGRARKMRAYVDHVLALLPFEPEAHERLGGPACTYIGHPLAERIGALRALDPSPLAAALGLDPDKPVLVVLPGSRHSEVLRLVEPFRDALAELVRRGVRPQIIVPVVAGVREDVEKAVRGWSLEPALVYSEADKLMAFRLGDAALAASGTVTLELAACGTPAVVAYKVDPVIAPVLRRSLPRNIHSVVLANLVAGENVYPEFLQEACTGETLAAALLPLFSDTEERRRQLAGLALVPERLDTGGRSPSDTAADIVLRYATGGRHGAPERL